MSKSTYLTSVPSGTLPDNTTRYFQLVGELELETSDLGAGAGVPTREAGTFSNLFTYVSANTINSATGVIIRIMKNGSQGNLQITYTSNQTGIKEDTSNTDSAAATDEFYWRATMASVSGSQTAALQTVSVQFDTTTGGNCAVAVNSVGDAISTASVTRFIPPTGSPGFGSTEADVAIEIIDNITASNLFTRVTANSRTTDTTIRSRKNGGFGNQTITYTSTQTGIKEDTSNSDSLVNGDDFCFSVTTSTGSNSITFWTIAGVFLTTSAKFPMSCGYPSSGTTAINTTRYLPFGGYTLNTITTEANTQYRPQFDTYFSRLHTYVSANSFTSATLTITVRDGGANSAVTVQYTAGQTGLKSDLTNVATITSATDLVNYSIVASNSGSGTATLRSLLVYGRDTQWVENDIAAAATLAISVTADLDAPGKLEAAAAVSISTAAVLNAPGSLNAAASISFSTAADLDAIGQLAAAAALAISATDVDLTSPPSDDLEATATLAVTTSAELTAPGKLEAAASLALSVAADLDAAGELTATAALVITTAADLDATGSLVAAATMAISAVADLDATGTLQAAAAVALSTAADLDATGSLVAAATLQVTTAADLDAIANIAAAASLAITVTADLTAPQANDMSAAATVSLTTSADLDAVGQLQAAAAIALSVSANVGDPRISAAATLAFSTSAILSAKGSLAAAASVAISTTAALHGAGPIAVTASVAVTAAASLTGAGDLDADADIEITASVVLDAQGNIVAVGSIQFTAAGSLVDANADQLPPINNPGVISGSIQHGSRSATAVLDARSATVQRGAVKSSVVRGVRSSTVIRDVLKTP